MENPTAFLKRIIKENQQNEKREVITSYNVVFFDIAIKAMEKYAKEYCDEQLLIKEYGTVNWQE